MNKVYQLIIIVVCISFFATLFLSISLFLENKGKNKYIKQLESIIIKQETVSATINSVYNISKPEADVYSYLAVQYPGNWFDYIAMIKVESNFKTNLTSNRNCKGLTQLHPNTLKEMCAKLNIEYKDDIIWNDIININAGFLYLAEARKLDSLNMFRIYVGGPNWAKANIQYKDYIEKYDKDIKKESKILELVYKGLSNETKIEN